MKRNPSRGILCAVIGGICWGFSGCCGQFLFDVKAMDSTWLSAVRLLCSGLILLAASLILHREQVVKILTTPRDRTTVLCFGVLGLMLCQLSYLTAIRYTNAATATVLQYTGPVLVMALVCLRNRRLPRLPEAIALVLAVGGTFLIATHGNPKQLVVSPIGLAWCAVAAVSVATYTLLSGNLGERYASIVLNGVGMTAGGIVLNLVSRSWTIPVALDLPALGALAAIILIGTVAAFSLFVQAIHDIGPVKASIIASVEPVSAAIISFFWLGNAFLPVDVVGFVCVLSTVFLLAKKE